MTPNPYPNGRQPYLTADECVQRYPLIVKCLQWKYILSESEAGCCIRDYRNGLSSSCEAISWCGRTPAEAICDATSEVCRQATFRSLRAQKAAEEAQQQKELVSTDG